MADQTIKERINISLGADVLNMGRELAKADSRSLSNKIEQLLRREHEQLVKEGKIQPAKEATV